MRTSQRFFQRLIRRAAWFATAKVVLTLIVLVFAVSISLTQKNYQAQIGGVIQVANNLSATDKGFTVAGSTVSATSCTSPVTFQASPQTANTAITAGHLVYDVQVNSTTSSPSNTKFNATLILSGATYGPVCIQVGTPLTATIDCKFDVGTALPSSPYSFKVSIQ